MIYVYFKFDENLQKVAKYIQKFFFVWENIAFFQEKFCIS